MSAYHEFRPIENNCSLRKVSTISSLLFPSMSRLIFGEKFEFFGILTRLNPQQGGQGGPSIRPR